MGRESDGIVRDVHLFCTQLLKLTRYLRVRGGTAPSWKYPSGCDVLAAKLSMVARFVNIDVIGGDDYIRTYERGADGEHMVRKRIQLPSPHRNGRGNRCRVLRHRPSRL